MAGVEGSFLRGGGVMGRYGLTLGAGSLRWWSRLSWRETTRDGDVAQLVERLHGMQEVESSILFVSIYKKRLWLDAKGVF